ncbi:MAG: transcription initiation factor IIB family protein [Candidatus Geothermarchaeales archaeon]
MMASLNDRQDKSGATCPECGSANVVHDDVHAEVVCGECGLVLRDGMEAGIEDHQVQRSHSGEVLTLRHHDRGLVTDISPVDRDHSGTTLGVGNRRQFSRLRTLQSRSRFSRLGEKSLAEGLSLIGKAGSHLFLPRSFIDEAAYLYRKVAEADVIRGRTIAGFVAASLYIAARLNEAPRTLQEVVEVLDAPRRQVTIALKLMLRRLRISLPPIEPESYIQLFASELGLSARVETITRQILGEVRKAERYNSKTPRGTAAAAIYMAAKALGRKVSQAEISRVARVSEVTIRTRVREIGEEIGLERVRGRPVYAGIHKCLRDVCLL